VYLEDFTPGLVVEVGSVSADEAEIIDFGRKFDPQPFHIDPVAALQSPFGGIIASGWHTCSMVMRAMVDKYFAESGSLGSPGVDEVRWLAPVRPNDRLRVVATVVSSRVSVSKPDRGIVVTEITATNQDDVRVLRYLATHLSRRRP
jgi:acyl dehydratase